MTTKRQGINKTRKRGTHTLEKQHVSRHLKIVREVNSLYRERKRQKEAEKERERKRLMFSSKKKKKASEVSLKKWLNASLYTSV